MCLEFECTYDLSSGLILKSVGVSQFLDFIPCSKNMFWELDLFLSSGGKVGKAPTLNYWTA